MKYTVVFFILIILASFRYLVMTGIYYFSVYKWLNPRLQRFKINQQAPEAKVMKHEIKWALFNKVNFGIIGVVTYWMYEQGYLKVYHDLDEYGLLYAILIVPSLLLLLDTYFYWLHYLMHYSFLKKTAHHGIHHASENVSPWSAFSVHPLEGFLEILIRPIILLTIPMHPYSLIGFLIVTFALNIIGHSGYEFFPKDYATSWLTKYKSCATFHYMHHQDGRYNLSLFFNFWDRVMGTINPDYEKFYAEVKNRQQSL